MSTVKGTVSTMEKGGLMDFITLMMHCLPEEEMHGGPSLQLTKLKGCAEVRYMKTSCEAHASASRSCFGSTGRLFFIGLYY